MNPGAEELRGLLRAIFERFFGQNGRDAPADSQVAEFSTRLSALIAERGLPRPLPANEVGAPGEMAETDIAGLVARSLPLDADVLFADAGRQIIKACFYPEFRTCRDSFCAVANDGSCRRQQLARVRQRISGTHCVDCPHWVALAPGEHETFLLAHWRGDKGEFTANRALFLPEDFRALRRWLHAKARDARR
jgi:hypothetical protein